MQGIDEYEGVIEHIYDFAEAQGLEIDTIIQEYGAGQLEVNLTHGDALDKADEVFLFKGAIKEAALRTGSYALSWPNRWPDNLATRCTSISQLSTLKRATTFSATITGI